jgi:hypothetical protein
MRTTPEGLIIMAQYNTRTLAEAIIGEDEVGTNAKAATRTLRKFLRDDMGEGKAVVGKGGRYALELKAQELRNMKKRFAEWSAKQEADKAARAELREAQTKVSVNAIAEDAVKGGDSVNSIAEDEELIEDDTVEGPTDEEIAALLADDEDLDEL